jgi:hypothetical protein
MSGGTDRADDRDTTGVTRVTDGVPTAGRAARLRAPLLLAGMLAAGTVALLVRNPYRHTWVTCPFKALTGWDCPACGGLRAVNDLGHARLDAAAHSNLLFVASLPLLALGWLVWASGSWRGRPARLGPRAAGRLAAAYAVLAVAFTIVRNTPWGSAFHVS